MSPATLVLACSGTSANQRTRAPSAIVFATMERDGEILRTNELALTFRAGSGFRAALSEHFARPYAFGCGLVAGGPDALVATDCANFAIAGLRRDGWRLPWGNPKQFAEHCEELATWKRGAAWPPLAASDLEAGAFVHFGSHVAVVWEDRAPVGQLDGNDLVAHHLEGLPEVVPLASLLRTRGQFRLLRLRPERDAVRLVFGGDVMLGRRVAEGIERGAEPLAGLADTLAGADLAMVNLECVASSLGDPQPGKRYHFRAHEKAPALLTAAGVDVVSLANNHARDFGEAARADAARRLRDARVLPADGSAVAIPLEVRGQRFAVFACEEKAGDALIAAIRKSAAEATVIVLAHWGTEHAAEPDEAQRATAAELVEAGARMVIGSGPHIRQPLVFQNGAVVVWSLGNLIFDGPGPDAGWSRGALLEVTVTRGGRIVRARELPVRIGEDGTATLE